MFVFKQKTAYEMRISDWSSDVCSSDLIRELSLADRSVHGPRDPPGRLRKRRRQKRARPEDAHPAAARSPRCHPAPPLAKPMADQLPCCPHHHLAQKPTSQTSRSEEHTSELQSLMRISYAVFCLKTKTH